MSTVSTTKGLITAVGKGDKDLSKFELDNEGIRGEDDVSLGAPCPVTGVTDSGNLTGPELGLERD